MSERFSNRLQEHRTSKGWSQQELARRSRLSRAAISAIETGRVVPSTAAALALAVTFGCSVESLFTLGSAAHRGDSAWAWEPSAEPCRFWQAVVGERTLLYPVERTLMGALPADGIHRAGTSEFCAHADAHRTLVVAGCDPAVGLLGAELARSAGVRMLPLIRSSRQALELLRCNTVHVAGIHLQDHEVPGGNARAVRDTLGPGYRLLRVARWQEGLALAPRLGLRTIRSATSAKLRWVAREKGSGARACLERMFRGRSNVAGRFAHVAADHTGVVETIRTGWAQAGVCVRLCAAEAGLDFLTVREEDYDLCYRSELQDDPRLQALFNTVRSHTFRRSIGNLPGYRAEETGALLQVSA